MKGSNVKNLPDPVLLPVFVQFYIDITRLLFTNSSDRICLMVDPMMGYEIRCRVFMILGLLCPSYQSCSGWYIFSNGNM